MAYGWITTGYLVYIDMQDRLIIYIARLNYLYGYITLRCVCYHFTGMNVIHLHKHHYIYIQYIFVLKLQLLELKLEATTASKNFTQP